MNSVRKVALAAALSAAVIAACSDSARIVGPSAQRVAFPGAKLNEMGTCTTIAHLNDLAIPLFGAGSPNVNSVLGKLDNLRKKVAAGDLTGAQEQANNIVSFVRDKAAQGQLLGTQAQVTELISGVLCYAGLSPDTFLILPSDAPQVRVSNEGTSGISLDGNTVTEPTLLTLTTLDPNGPSPLITELDQYPSYVGITASSNLTKPAVVAVCPLGEIPADVRDRLRLGHQAADGFEIAPDADASFLPCGATLGSTPLPSWASKLASLFTPTPLYAAMEGGGVGGSVTEFSPFGAVDTELGFSGGGVGGSATEFLRAQPTGPATGQISAVPNGTANSVAPNAPNASGGITAVSVGTASDTDCSATTVGTEIAAACRPSITITTHNGTALEGVPVAWAVESGNGSVAPHTDACGTFGQTAATTSDSAGRAGICWILGPEGGANTVTAIATFGGEAPEGVTFTPTRLRFTATGLKITPTASATGGSFVFDNLPHAGTGSCSNDLTPALSYAGTGAPTDAPVAAGQYTLTVTCGAGSNVYNTVTADAGITITPTTPLVVVTCPASVVYDGTAQTPCAATATAPGLSLTLTPAYANNTNVGTAYASASLAASGNYADALGSTTFAITPAPTTTVVSCPASVTFTGEALAPCTAGVTGPGGLNESLAVVYTNNTNAGTAAASASFAGGGNYVGSSDSEAFTIDKAATSVSVSCSSVVYNGSVQTPCTATVTGNALTAAVDVTYVAASPRNADSYTASAAYAGGANWLAGSNSASFSITRHSATATAGNATINFGSTVPTIPCSVSGLLAADAGSVTCTTTVPTITIAGTYATTPAVSPASPVNYDVTKVNGTLTVAGYVQVSCFSSPIYSVMPPSKSAQRKGSNLPVKCGLTTPQGAPVTSAKGDLVVVDRGTSGSAEPVTVFGATNVFKYSSGGNYAYGLDTSPSGFVAGHYYYVTATWNDGSTSTGWFLLK